MLTHLSVRNFTLVDHLDLEFTNGMTAITGETGAGKSILLDALSLTLGDRADFDRIRTDADRAEVTAIFDLASNRAARQWLEQQQLEAQDECILRRLITRAGKSSAWINGNPVTSQLLRQIAQLLISIHSQHEHQALTRTAYHRELVDDYGSHQDLLDELENRYEHLNRTRETRENLEQNFERYRENRELLQFQADDLAALNLQPDEYPDLEREQAQLANAESILTGLQTLIELMADNEEFNLHSGIYRTLDRIDRLPSRSPALDEAAHLLQATAIQLDEATSLVRQEQNRVELNPSRLAQVEDRLGQIFTTARKYRCKPEELTPLYQQLSSELAAMSDPDDALQSAREAEAAALNNYLLVARKLSNLRGTAAQKLCNLVNQRFDQLAMQGAAIRIRLEADETKPRRTGIDDIELEVRTNPGAPFGAIAKIASGGELSRISLAIQVVTAHEGQMPTLIFDEVDVGIGGATANTVGGMLRELGQRAQVICITHLAQVASKADSQLRVLKSSSGNSTTTRIEPLQTDERIEELARMLGGAVVSSATRANAEELLKQN